MCLLEVASGFFYSHLPCSLQGRSCCFLLTSQLLALPLRPLSWPRGLGSCAMPSLRASALLWTLPFWEFVENQCMCQPANRACAYPSY